MRWEGRNESVVYFRGTGAKREGQLAGEGGKSTKGGGVKRRGGKRGQASIKKCGRKIAVKKTKIRGLELMRDPLAETSCPGCS